MRGEITLLCSFSHDIVPSIYIQDCPKATSPHPTPPFIYFTILLSIEKRAGNTARKHTCGVLQRIIKNLPEETRTS